MPGSSEVGSERSVQLLTATDVAQRYAFWRMHQQPFGIEIDSELKKLVNAYGSSRDEELKNHFLLAVAQMEAALGGEDKAS